MVTVHGVAKSRDMTERACTFISLSMMSSSFILVVSCIRIPFLFKAELYSIVSMDHILLICSSIDGQLSFFDLLSIVDNTAVNTAIQTPVRVPVSVLLDIYTQKWNCWVRYSVQFTQSCLTLCDPMDSSSPGLPIHHQLLELLKLMSIELVMPSNHLILCGPLLLPPSIFPSIRVFVGQILITCLIF